MLAQPLPTSPVAEPAAPRSPRPSPRAEQQQQEEEQWRDAAEALPETAEEAARSTAAAATEQELAPPALSSCPSCAVLEERLQQVRVELINAQEDCKELERKYSHIQDEGARLYEVTRCCAAAL